MHPSLPPALGAAVLLCLVFSATAQVVFKENFNDVETPGELSQWRGDKNAMSEADGAWMEIRKDADNAFGEGTGNRFLALHDRSETAQVYTLAVVSGQQDVVTAAFDFIEPPDAEAGPFIFRIGTADNSDTELAANVDPRDGHSLNGTQDAYQLGTKHRLTVVVNNSAETVSYGGQNLPSQHYDLHLDGNLLSAVIPFDNKDGTLTPSAPLDAIRLLTYLDQTVFLDNIKVESGAHKP